jgi:hypothetical protein
MATVVATPLPPGEQLERLCSALGSQGAVGRLLNRQVGQITRWRKHPMLIRPTTAQLIDDGYVVVELVEQLTGAEDLERMLLQRWHLLGERAPVDLLHKGEVDELVDALVRARAQAASAGRARVEEDDDDAAEQALVAWFSENIAGDLSALPTPLPAAELDDEDDGTAVKDEPWLSLSWRRADAPSSGSP